MQVSYDPDARATYVELHDSEVHHTVEVSDLVMVDVDEVGHAVGVEFLVLPNEITPDMVELAVHRFTSLKSLRDFDTWLEPGMPRQLAHLF